MATEDWWNIRGGIEWFSEQTMNNTIGMTRLWEQKYWMTDVMTELTMAILAFTVAMSTIMIPIWTERKLIARFMDHRGSTVAIRSIWTGEGNMRIEWWKDLLASEFPLVG